MKKIIAIAALVAVLLVGGKVASNIIDNTKQDRFLLGDWEAVAGIALEQLEYIPEGVVTMSFDRKGNTFYQRDDWSTEYTWESTSYLSDLPAFKYELRTADGQPLGEVFAISDKAFLLREVRGTESGSVEASTIFVKKGKAQEFDSSTDFSQLLGFDPADLGFTYIEDKEAFSYIDGSWYSIKMHEDGSTTFLSSSTVSLNLDGGKYEITMMDEFSEGTIDYTGIAEDMYIYYMEGEYESISRVYNNTDDAIIMFEEDTKIAIILCKR